MSQSTTNPNKIGAVFGAILGGWHLAWALLVWLGFAQKFYDFILWAHMIHLEITIGPFNPKAALFLIAVTSVMGYLFGYIGALIWNGVNKK